ncbi:MAG: hypothetical protein JRG91_21450 [Deltaproteobacteria bacterium]|nr:hypothetical protein [Deltaproteobacteria bacterium]
MLKHVPKFLVASVLVAGVALAGNSPPGIMFSTLLDNVKMQSGTGYFMIDNKLQAVFIPDKSSGSILLSKADGAKLYRYDWEGELIKQPYVRLAIKGTTDLKKGEKVYDYPVLGVGDYVLDFFLGEDRFYTYPFSVSKKASPDPFLGGDLFFLEGAWSDWSYLYYSNADPEKNLIWKVWLRHQSHEVVRKDADIHIEIIGGKGKKKKVLCQSRPNKSYSLPRDWARFSFDMVNPPVKTSGGEYFKAKDLLAKDGKYTLVMKLDGKAYGKWKFEVKGGKLQYTGLTERGKADPLTFIEGGRDAWWYRKGN